MDSIDLPAGTIHYREAGPADGRPVVFVHGFLVDDTLWSDVPERLAERGLPHLRADLAARLRTRPPMNAGADLSPRGVARVVAVVPRGARPHDVVLVGSDTGGAVCQFLLDEDPARIGRAGAHQLRRVRHVPAVPVRRAVPARPAPGAARARAPADAPDLPAHSGSASAGWSAASSPPRRAGPG